MRWEWWGLDTSTFPQFLMMLWHCILTKTSELTTESIKKTAIWAQILLDIKTIPSPWTPNVDRVESEAYPTYWSVNTHWMGHQSINGRHEPSAMLLGGNRRTQKKSTWTVTHDLPGDVRRQCCTIIIAPFRMLILGKKKKKIACKVLNKHFFFSR